MDLQPIKASYIIKKEKQAKSIENPNIGVIDLETYTDTSLNRGRVYSAGLYTKYDKRPITFYIDKKTKDNNKVIYDLLDQMFSYKYKGIIWYCHNFGDFDSLFIISTIDKYNKYLNNENKYKLKFVERKGSIIKLTIVNKIRSSVYTIEIRDSYAILTDGLRDLCKKYEIEKEKEKGCFPHKFANENRLFYIGNTPSITYFDNLSVDRYKSIWKSN